MNKLSENLQYEMDLRGLNAYDLESMSGVSQPTINRILKGKHIDPRTTTVKKLADALRISEFQLRAGSKDDKISKSSSLLLTLSNFSQIERVKWHDLDIYLNSVPKSEVYKLMTLNMNVSSNSFAILVTSQEHDPYVLLGETVVIDPDASTLTKNCLIEMNGQYSFMRHIMRDKEYFQPVIPGASQIAIDNELNHKIIGVVTYIMPPYREG